MRDLHLAFRDRDDKVLMHNENTNTNDLLNAIKALTAVLVQKSVVENKVPMQDVVQAITNRIWDGVHKAIDGDVEKNPEDVESWQPSWLNAVDVDKVVKALNDKLYAKEQEIYQLKQDIGRLKNADSNALPQADKKESANRENIEDFLKEHINARDNEIERLSGAITLLNDENNACKKVISDQKKRIAELSAEVEDMRKKAQQYYDEKESLEKADFVHMEEISKLQKELGKANRGVLRYEQKFLEAAGKLYPDYFVCLKLIPHDRSKPEVHKIAKKEGQ